MSSHDQHTLTGAYAADALDDAERDEFERHLASCASCRQEVAELQATATRLATASSAQAPAGMRERVLAEAARTRQLSPLSSVTSLAARRPWYRQPVTAAAAVLLVVAAGLGVVAVQANGRADRARSLADRVAAVAADPQHLQRTVAFSSGGTGTVVSAHGIALFHATGLTELPPGQAYQLWRLTGNEPHSAGVLGRGGELTRVVTGVAPGDALGVTVEPSGGSDRPTTKPVFLVSMA